jgi:1,4-dihydroxy-2-naphthoate octaprenyltransferase
MTGAPRLPAGEPAPAAGGLVNFLVHLRLQFQFILSGIFLWAYLLAGGVPDRRAWCAFGILHLLLYGGTTAYNSYYDQDTGPVTGLRRPPRAGVWCRTGGLGFMLVGAALSLAVSTVFAALYAAIMLLSIGYSHPRVRWKNGPVSSLAVVALGQGVLGFVAGAVVAAPGGWPVWTAPLGAGGVAATLLTTGLYPLTQVFQVEEDLARGDRTFAARFGPRTVFRTAFVCFAAALAAALPAARTVFAPAEVVLLAVALTALCVVIALWERTYDPARRIANHDRVFAIGLATSSCFVILIVRQLWERVA